MNQLHHILQEIDKLPTKHQKNAVIALAGISMDETVIEGDMKYELMEEPAEVVEIKKGPLIPITIEGVTLKIMMRFDDIPGIRDRTEKQFELIDKLRKKFGDDSLLEELYQICTGTVESVRIVGGPKRGDNRIPIDHVTRVKAEQPNPTGTTGPGTIAPSLPGIAGTQVVAFSETGPQHGQHGPSNGGSASSNWSPPSPEPDPRGYNFECPRFAGQNINTLDPKFLKYVLEQEPWTITQNDGNMIVAFLQTRQAKWEMEPKLEFKDDSIPF